ncbi:AI-2E family transporter, partial [Xanthomonas citri pv. citri]|nr:AI-2E family transporter [Xanthomonas citri pv. citri]
KSPLHTNEAQLTHLMQKAEAAMAGSQGRIASTAAAAGSQIGRFGAGLVMALFATFFFVYEGDKLAEKSAVLIPREHRA